jgi:hypothetical protein
MTEQKFTNCQGERFIIEFDGDRVVEVYSKSHDVLAEITETGLGQYLASWPNAIHPTMRVIPCLGRDGWPFWIVQEFTAETIILDR